MINPVIYPITLDVYKTGSQKVLSMVRGDNKRVISVALTENGKPYTITEGCTAFFTALKPDGTYIYNACEIDFKNNTINYQVTDQTTAVNGIVACQIRLIGANGGILSAPSFTMVVSDLLYNEEPIVDSSNEFNALTRFIADLQYKLENGEFNGKSITIKGSVSDVSELDAKIPHVVAGDGYLADDNHLYVFDGTAFVDVGLVRGPRGFSGVYVGSGDMPEGYNVQIDDSGDALEMDTELSLTSENPVQNKAVTAELMMLDSQVNNLADRDYIVEQGQKSAEGDDVANRWTYRKWASGIAECWCRVTYSGDVTQKCNVSNRFISDAVNALFPNGLFVEGAPVFVQATQAFGIVGFELMRRQWSYTTNTKTGDFLIVTEQSVSATSIADSPFSISFEAKGRWKE